MGPFKLAEFTEAADAHAELERVLTAGEHPAVECRVDPTSAKPHQVWSGPVVR